MKVKLVKPKNNSSINPLEEEFEKHSSIVQLKGLRNDEVISYSYMRDGKKYFSSNVFILDLILPCFRRYNAWP